MDRDGTQPAVAELTDGLVGSYGRIGAINHLDGKNLPSKRAVGLIARDLLRLLFPGFFEERVLHSRELAAETGRLLESVLRRLESELAKSLEYSPTGPVRREELPKRARELAVGLLEGLPAVREVLSTDIEAAYGGDPAALNPDEVILAYPFVEAIAVQRVAHELYLRDVPLIPRIMTEWAHSRTGLDLHPGAEIGPYFFVDHCTGTVVGETTRIGSHVKLYQGVGLVARSLSGGQALRGRKRHPTLEDRVTIYAGATIIGGDTVIGAGSTIGASVFLTHSVPPNSLVVNEDVRVRVTAKGDWAPDYQI